MKNSFYKTFAVLGFLLCMFHSLRAEKISSFDWTDKSTVTSSTVLTAENLAKLTDNDPNTVFTPAGFTSGTWIKFEMPQSFKITGYSLTASNSVESAPKSWILEGSQDGTTWSIIDSRSNITFSQAKQTNSYQLSFPGDRETISSYKYIRITFSGINGGQTLELAELQLFGFPSQLVTDITGNGGLISGQYAGYTGEGVENLINNLISKKYCVVGQSTGWVEYESPTEVLLTSYSLTSCVANVERDPKAWELAGYNESTSTWETIDTRNNQDFMMRFSTMEYRVQPAKSYSRFRLTITQNNGEGNFQFCKWQLFGTETSSPRIKVACVGNSITENLALPENQKYPSILQTFLGEDYQVRNYGLGGRTLLKKGNLPYWNESKYAEVKSWNPNIVVIKLGTNDSKSVNWQYKGDFVSDYVEFINSFKNLSSHPTVYICKPLPAYPNTMNIDGTVIHDEMLPMIEQISQLAGVQIIDLYTPLEGKQSYLYDNVHPNVKGTTIMAHYVCKAINPLHEIPSDLYSQVNTFDWTDLAVAVTSSNSATTDYSTLTDNDLSTSFEGGQFFPNSWIQVELPELFKITGYALSSDSVPAGAPKKWKLQGSVNGTDWVDIESKENIQFLHKQETNLFQLTLPGDKETIPAYKYIRITFLENNGGSDLRFSEWQIFGFPTQLVTNITGNGGVITGEYAGYQENGYVETVDKLINNAIGEKYCVVGQSSGWIEYRSSTKVKLSGYSLTRCGALYERDPKSWTLQAYDNDTQTWVTLDTRENQDFMAQFNTMKYKVNTNKSYLRFRLNITAIQGTSTFQFAKWQLFGEETSAPIAITKVACIGNSITANARLNYDDRYPTILQKLLGETYSVENFGVGGATLLKGSSYPYWDQSAYTKALAFVPDIIVIKLGTNDSNPSNWMKKANFVGDYVDFINSFKAVNPNVKVFTCYPITSWNSTMPIVDKTIVDEIIPMIDIVAAQTGATVVDLHTPTFGKVYQTYDYVHPDVRGTTLMANTIYKAIEPSAAEPYMNPAYISNLNSFDRTDSVVSSSSSANVEVADLFDNNLNTEVDFGTFSNDMYFQFDLPENFRVTGYSLTTAQGDMKNTPKSWILQGSADKSTWNTIETRTNQKFYYPTETNLYQIAIEDNKTANAEKLPAYKYFRVLFKENNGGTSLKLSEFQLYGMNKVMVTSITGNGGSITGQYAGYQNGTEYVETVDKLIDNNISSKYCVTGHTGGWIQYESAVPVRLGAYSITGSMNDISRNPKTWELFGSDNGTNWELIDEQQNQESKFFVRLNTVEYPVSTTKKYKYFKLNILENNGGSEFQLTKWQLFENAPTSSIQESSIGEPVKISSESGIIKLTCTGKTKYDIYNLMGTLVTKGQCESGTHTIPVASQGLYIVKTNNHSTKISVIR